MTPTRNMNFTAVEYFLQSRGLLVKIGSPSHFFFDGIGKSGIRTTSYYEPSLKPVVSQAYWAMRVIGQNKRQMKNKDCK
jgi:hypothetical protein